MTVTPGTRLRSQVCSTEVIVIRAGSLESLQCGGAPMIALTGQPDPALALDQAWTGTTPVGKRYTDATESIEVLVTKGGPGILAAAGERLVEKGARPLPSSD